ncbi:hypothetical protein, conserved [Eimeria tenella]|uniref:Uncharacterized protein n=1 Tax=Eimeria tenella TaxID=5802 RepID=U6KR69_EIMTE|nr:hypothetical protein, conserved [Eimeria tenella]CDJ40441.1 hypothetical protein, conserved [Eimeria tenella]|eukprot:XP_013231191.1 hypothetical protein, conserved [Eimeria tenella]
MGASQSKERISRFGLRELRLSSSQGRRPRLLPAADSSGDSDRLQDKGRKRPLRKRRGRRKSIQRAWLCYRGRTLAPTFTEGQIGSTVPMPWLDKPQRGNSASPREEPFVEDQRLASGTDTVNAGCSDTGPRCVERCEEQAEFAARPWQVSTYSRKGGPLCMAYAKCLDVMEEDVVAALIHHPSPDEALGLMYICCSPAPLSVEPTLEPSADVLGYVFPGTCFKVLDVRAHIAQMSYLLRLKTAEGWVTGASLQMIRLPQPPRVTGWKTTHEEAVAAKPSQRGSTTGKPSVSITTQQQAGDLNSFHCRAKCGSFTEDIHPTIDGGAVTDGSSELEESPSTGWGTVYACRATRFLSFQECLMLAEERTSYSSLNKLTSAATMQKFEAALQKATTRHFPNAGSSFERSNFCTTRTEGTRFDSSRIVTRNSIRSGGLSPLEHSFMLFRVVGSRAVPISATPHLGSRIVGRLLRRQVFPVLDACLVCCVPSCGRPGTGNDCIIAGLGTLGAGESDLLHAVPTTRLCGKKSKRNLCYFTRNRRVHLRVCTDKGWVTLDRLIERVDECETIYDRPVLYEIVADGYLVNVRPALEIEGQVRRTLPPATLVEVYERKINAEGLVRLRLIDGWINERRKSSGETGFLFATRTVDRRVETFLRHIMAVVVLLPALCSSDSRVRTAAASWVAATVAQSAIAASALMEVVDTDLVESAIRPCSCCYCRGLSVQRDQGNRVTFRSNRPASVCSSSQRHGDCCFVSPRGTALCVNKVTGGSPGNNLKSGRETRPSGDNSHQSDAIPALSSPPSQLKVKDLLLAESPVMESPSSLGSALPNPGTRLGEDDRSNTFASIGSGVGLVNVHAGTRGNDCSVGRCHRGRCIFEDIETMHNCIDTCRNNARDFKKSTCPWDTLFSLIKVSSHCTARKCGCCLGRAVAGPV